MRYVYRIMYTEARDRPNDEHCKPYQVEYRPWWWPFWFDSCGNYRNLEECEKEIRKLELVSKPRRLVAKIGYGKTEGGEGCRAENIGSSENKGHGFSNKF